MHNAVIQIFLGLPMVSQNSQWSDILYGLDALLDAEQCIITGALIMFGSLFMSICVLFSMCLCLNKVSKNAAPPYF